MKYLLITITLSFVLSFSIQAQEDSSMVTITYMSSAPLFNHGTADNFQIWLYKNVEYPESALTDSISGKVIASFMIDSTGIVKNIKILRGVRYDIDSVVIKVLGSSPKWTPAKQGERNISVPLTVQIRFDIADPYFQEKIKNLRPYSKKKKRH